MKRVVPDQGLSPRTAEILNSAGWDAIHVADAGLNRSEDVEILEFARREGRVCITLDHDFHAHLAMARESGPSVVLLRIEGLNAQGQAGVIQAVWERCSEPIAAGAAVSTDGSSIRVRKLPLR